MFFALTMSSAWAADPAVDADTRARQLNRTGAIEVTAGVAALASGVTVMLVGRGVPGEISTESQRTSDLKSVGGAVLLIGGFTTTLVGGNTLGKAHALREQVAVGAIIDPHGGGGLRIVGTF